MKKGKHVVILEKGKEAYMIKQNPYSVIKSKIGNLYDKVYIGLDRKVVMYIDDCACLEEYGQKHLGINRKVEGLGTIYGNIVICNTEKVGPGEIDLCGFTEDEARIIISWAEQYTTIL